jgi:hypothetical protein
MAKAKPKKLPDEIEAILEAAQSTKFVRVATARVPFIDQELRDEHARLDAELKAAIEHDRRANDVDDLNPVDTTEPIAARLQEIEDEIDSSIVEFRFRGVGKKAWSDLAREHPPTEAQLKVTPRAEFNEDTFPAAIMALSCESPKMTLEQSQQLLASPVIDPVAYMELWGACLRANVFDDAPKSLVLPGVIRHMSGGSSKQHTTIESPGPSSSDE